MKAFVPAFALSLLMMGTTSVVAGEKSQAEQLSLEEKQVLLEKVEEIEQQLRDRQINIGEFQESFSRIDGLPTGNSRDRVLEAQTAPELRSALDNFKSELQEPRPLWMKILIGVVVVFVILMVLMLLFTRDGWILVLLIFSGGSGGSDF